MCVVVVPLEAGGRDFGAREAALVVEVSPVQRMLIFPSLSVGVSSHAALSITNPLATDLLKTGFLLVPSYFPIPYLKLGWYQAHVSKLFFWARRRA
jgi:hypothetical protein